MNAATRDSCITRSQFPLGANCPVSDGVGGATVPNVGQSAGQVVRISFAAMLAALVALLVSSCTAIPAGGPPASETSALEAALQDGDVTGLHRCALSGSYPHAIAAELQAGHTDSSLPAAWSRLQAEGARDAVVVEYAALQSDCLLTPSQVSGKTVVNFVVKFDTEQRATAAYQAGSIFSPPGTPEQAAGLGGQTGEQTGLGPNSWMLSVPGRVDAVSWSVRQYYSAVSVAKGGGVTELKELAGWVYAREQVVAEIGTPQNLKVTAGNGYVDVAWSPPAIGANLVTDYVVRASPIYNNRLPQPFASPVMAVDPPTSPLKTRLSGLLEDCHQMYQISVGTTSSSGVGPLAIYPPPVRPSGVVEPGAPPFVVILLDGIGESKPYFSMNPYHPTQDEIPSYCPESWNSSSNTEKEAAFAGAPSGPWEFFNKWNFSATGNDSGDSTPRDYYTGQETHSFMLDAIAAQGAIILPYGYRGVSLTKSTFSMAGYSKCNSTPPGGVPGVSLDPSNLSLPDSCVLDSGPDGARQSIDTDVAMLQDEVSQVNRVWGSSRIVIVGHSQGGLIAFLWWLQHGADTVAKNVTNLFALDSPINGVCVAPVFTGCTGGPEGYPDYSKRTDADHGPAYLATDAKTDNRFRFIGTWGEKVLGYGIENNTLQVQLLVKGSPTDPQGAQCGYGTNNLACPSPPDLISDCPIVPNSTNSNWWVTGPINYHFVVKWCPDDVAYFNKTLRLDVSYTPQQERLALNLTTSGACRATGQVTRAGEVVAWTRPGTTGTQPLPLDRGETVTYQIDLSQPASNLSVAVWLAGIPTPVFTAPYEGASARGFSGLYLVPSLPPGVYGTIPVHAEVSGDAQCTFDGIVFIPTPTQSKVATVAVAIAALLLLALLVLV
jgi:hypothetical protein